jgi:hypothetical protein
MAKSESRYLMAPPSKDDGAPSDPPVSNPPYIGTDRAERQSGFGGGGGGGAGGNNVRIDHLELRMSSVESKLDTIIERLAGVSTKSDMRNFLLLTGTLFVAVCAILVAGLGWLETRAARVQQAPIASAPPAPPTAQPIIIQVPYPASDKK